MDPATAKALSSLAQLAKTIEGLAEVGARAYASPVAGQAAPIVDDRFKGAGNKRFPPLAASTLAQKSGSVRKAKASGQVRAGVFFGGKSGTGSKLIKGGKPILVNSGALRAAVKVGALIVSSVGVATITFRGLPDYAVYLRTGTAKMPMRSPVDLNPADRERVLAAMRRVLSAALGAAGPVAQQLGSVPSLARLA